VKDPNVSSAPEMMREGSIESARGTSPAANAPLASRLPLELPAIESTEATAALEQKGLTDSAQWRLQEKKSDSRELQEILKRADRILSTALRPKRSRKLLAAAAPNSDLRGHRPLLEMTIRELSEILRSDHPLPQALPTAESTQPLPRAYLASHDYLLAESWKFSEPSFVPYFRGVEKRGDFEIAELWLLSPMLQLNLIAHIAEIITPAEAGPETPSITQLCSILTEVRQANWKEIFSQLSLTEHILESDPAKIYSLMDFESCDSYREAIQELAQFSESSESEIASLAVNLAAQALANTTTDSPSALRHGHVGYFLIDKGRRLIESQIRYRPQGEAFLRHLVQEVPGVFFFVGIEFILLAIMAFVLSSLQTGVPFILGTILLLLPASQAAIEVTNQLLMFLVPPRKLPKLDFSAGIPDSCFTAVAVPTLLMNEEQVRDLARDLEIRYLGNRDPNLCFVLLTDTPDSSLPVDEKDELVGLCSELIAELNSRYTINAHDRFFQLHRHRRFNEVENTWMGWERKRGKLLDFNEFLRGSSDRFPVKVGNVAILENVRYVLTLDSDTQLPRDSARQLVGAIAHPLNRAQIDPVTNVVTDGYGVLQPRVGISVHSVNQSRLAYIYSGQTGLDTYTHATSDIYQDLFQEAIFTGKGIYEVDVFRKVLGDRFPSNAILSHDLIEGSYARTGLVSDVEVIDDYPSHFRAYSRRKHRWVRGDWQILRWLLPSVRNAQGEKVENPLSMVSRWKILDNLRRSMFETALFILFLCSWFFLPGSPVFWTAATIALLLIPGYTQAALSLARVSRPEHFWATFQQIFDDFITNQINALLLLAFLAHQSLITLDAVVRTVFRLTVSHRNLLQWETAAQSEMENKRKTPVDVYMDLTPLVAIVIGGCLWYFKPHSLPVAAPILLLWAFAKPLTKWLDRPLRPAKNALTNSDVQFVRQLALKTWRYFREYATAEDNWLVPDNIQGDTGEIAHRISTTNLGMQLNAQYAALNLGFLTLPRFTELARNTMNTAMKLPRHRGHMVNWYDSCTLAPLEPQFISSVDNGNLACCLWTLKQGCLASLDQPLFPPTLFSSVADGLAVAIESRKSVDPQSPSIAALEKICTEIASAQSNLADWCVASRKCLQQIEVVTLEIDAAQDPHTHWWLAASHEKLRDILSLATALAPWMLHEFQSGSNSDSTSFDSAGLANLSLNSARTVYPVLLEKAQASAQTEFATALQNSIQQAAQFRAQLQDLASDSHQLVADMDFNLLYDPRRKALSVGYDVKNQRREASCYDLLASEARTAVFIAIAKGDIPQLSWFSMARTHTRYAGQNALLSWTGTMFEYLMPTLWFKTYPSTLLHDGMHSVVACQQAYVAKHAIPWGISEGAASEKNDSGHYFYYAFGLPELALKADASSRIVITPYASALALSLNPPAVIANFREMVSRGWSSPYGFYESADYVQDSATNKSEFRVVRSWMAHHQGMILLSVCNLLGNGVFQELFHQEPMVAATERVLHEKRLTPLNLELVTVDNERTN
jgi:cyclic beta-1,2-glucan synthetase